MQILKSLLILCISFLGAYITYKLFLLTGHNFAVAFVGGAIITAINILL